MIDTASDRLPSGFAAGTLVHTKEGLKPIETIQVGDWVLSKHESGAGEREYKRVTRTFVHEDREVIMLSVGGLQEDGTRFWRDLVLTPEHPVWVQGKGWKPAGKIKATFPYTKLELISPERPDVAGNARLFVTEQPGVAWKPVTDSAYHLASVGLLFEIFTLRELGSAPPPMKRVRSEFLYRATVYNFEVEDFHTYYVGEAGIWVYAP